MTDREFDEFLPRDSNTSSPRSTFPLHVQAGDLTQQVILTLEPTALPGICGNRDDADGSLAPDYSFVSDDQETELRPFVTLARLPVGHPSPRNNLRMTVDVAAMRRAGKFLGSRPPFPADTIIGRPVITFTVRVTSFDYGGRCLVTVGDGRPEAVAALVFAPVDTDDDLLPDAWERQVTGGDLTKLWGSRDLEVWPGQTEPTGDGFHRLG